MSKKSVAQRPRQRRAQVTSCTITPAAWNRLRSFVFQLQNGKPLAFEACLALERGLKRKHRDLSTPSIRSGRSFSAVGPILSNTRVHLFASSHCHVDTGYCLEATVITICYGM
jgi:hypothetical protein